VTGRAATAAAGDRRRLGIVGGQFEFNLAVAWCDCGAEVGVGSTIGGPPKFAVDPPPPQALGQRKYQRDRKQSVHERRASPRGQQAPPRRAGHRGAGARKRSAGLWLAHANVLAHPNGGVQDMTATLAGHELYDLSRLGIDSPFKKRYETTSVASSCRRQGTVLPNISPVVGSPFTEIARSTAEDVELALDAAHEARERWGHTSAAERALILNRIADRMEENLAQLALAETIDNGSRFARRPRPIFAGIDHFRYFAAALRSQEGSISEVDHDTIAYHFHEPLGVVGQIIHGTFRSSWRRGSWRRLWRRNCVVLKPPSRLQPRSWSGWSWSPTSCPGRAKHRTRLRLEAGKPLASSKRIAKIAFTGETTTDG